MVVRAQSAVWPFQYSKVQPTSAGIAKKAPMMNSHQPTARPAKQIAAEAPRKSGHQLCGLKKPYSPWISSMSPSGSSDGSRSRRRRVIQRYQAIMNPSSPPRIRPMTPTHSMPSVVDAVQNP